MPWEELRPAPPVRLRPDGTFACSAELGAPFASGSVAPLVTFACSAVLVLPEPPARSRRCSRSYEVARMMTMDELREMARTSPEIQERVAKQAASFCKRTDVQTIDQRRELFVRVQAAMIDAANLGDKETERKLRIQVLALDALTRENAVITGDVIEKLAKTLAKMPDKAEPGGAIDATDPIEAIPGKRRRVLVPALEQGDLVALRYLASWRFASPTVLAALAWPGRSADGQEWRMRRMVNCGMFGRRRLRFAASRHVVWARSLGTQLVLSPPPPQPLVSPRWNEDSARHGWMRSVSLHAYVKAGWQVQLAGTEGLVVEALKAPGSFLSDAANARLFGDGRKTYPFDLALGVRATDKKPLLHIIIPDEPSSSLQRILGELPFEKPRSSRLGVRFFPIDDVTFWSRSAGRYTLHSPRSLRMVTGLTEAGLDIPPENAGPEIGHWAQLG